MAALRFYLDENLPVAIATQLTARAIEAVTVRDERALGDTDENHLTRATRFGYVLCTQDADFLRLAKSGVEHAGIIYSQMNRHGIGEWVIVLSRLHSTKTAEDFLNRVEFL